MASVSELRTDTPAGWRQRLSFGAYRYAEAARLAQTNHQTIVAWLKLVQRERAVSESGTADQLKLLSYLQLLELAVVARFRRSGVRLADIASFQRALIRRGVLRDEPSAESRHPFALRSFMLDGVLQAVQRPDAWPTLERALQQRQDSPIWSPIIGEFFDQVEDDEHLIVRWYPRGREQGVVVDPRLSFGTPVIAGSGIPTYIVRERHTAGETLDDIALDYGLTLWQVAAAVRFEHSLATPAA